MTLIGSLGQAFLRTTDVGEAIGEEGASHIDRRRKRQDKA